MNWPPDEARDLVDSFAEPALAPLPRRMEPDTRRHVEPEPLQLESLQALLQRDIDAPRWLVPNMVPMAGVTYLAGQPKSGKSWLALILATAVAEGGEFLGRELDAEGPVLIVDAEVSPAMLQERVRLVAAGHLVNNDALARIHVHHGRLFLDREEQLARLKAAVAEVQPALVVLDPLAKMHGGLNENDASDMAWLAGAVRELTLIGGPAVLVVHHTVKVGDGRRGGTLLRGSSALWADADSLILLEREAGELTVSIDGRYCSGDQRLAARLDIQADHVVPTARLAAMDAPLVKAARADAVLAVLQQHPAGLTVREIRAATRSNNKTAKIALEALRDAGQAREAKRGGLAVWTPRGHNETS